MSRRLGTPVDRIIAMYALVSGVAFLFSHRPAAWPLLAALHLVAVLFGFGLPPVRGLWDAFARARPRTAAFVGDWYPLVLVPLLYTELATLNSIVYAGHYFDPLILHWEAVIFGGQPSQEWAVALPSLVVSELLHGAYLSYYLIIYVPAALLYASRQHEEFRESVFALMLVFFAHYLFFIYFPVQGPRYLFDPPVAEAAQGWMHDLAHRLLQAGSSQGAAFPSSHVGIGVAQTVIVARFLPRLTPIVALLAIGLALGAIYGGFHYAIDAVAGLVLGLAVVLVAPRLYHRMNRTRTAAA
jgi:membrane-associated phospholipid phosphatase